MVETVHAKSDSWRLFGGRVAKCLLSAVCALCACRLAAATFTLSETKAEYENERIEASEKGGESDTYTIKVPKNKKAHVHVYVSGVDSGNISTKSIYVNWNGDSTASLEDEGSSASHSFASEGSVTVGVSCSPGTHQVPHEVVVYYMNGKPITRLEWVDEYWTHYQCAVTYSISVTYGDLGDDDEESGKPTFKVVNGKLTSVKLNGATAVTIPSTVTSIGDEVFRDCKGLASVKIPKGVKSIGRLAFSDCSGLTSVTLPGSVTSIGDWAFYGCTGLKSLTIPSSVKSIGMYAFHSCWYLDKVQIGAGVTKIGEAAFGNCRIASLVVASANGAYEKSGGLLLAKSTGKVVAATSQIYKLTIPDFVTSIGAWAFSGCEEMCEVTIPASVTSIEDNAFCNCRKLVAVTMPKRFQGNLPSGVFSNCSSSLKVTYFDAPAPTNYTVTFSANGGKVSETKRKVKKNAAVGTLPKATRTGYALKGWYTAKSGGSKVSASTKVSKNVTYYAQWTANKYNIKFNANGGTGSMKTLSATYGKTVTLTANAFKKSQYTFAGWATKKGGSVAYKNKAKVKNLTATKGKTVTIYAVWKKAKSSSVKSAAVSATAVPAWAVGTFYGGDGDSLSTITVSKAGKVSGKALFADGSRWTIVGKAVGQRIATVVTDADGNSAEVVFAIVKTPDGRCRIESEDGSIWVE